MHGNQNVIGKRLFDVALSLVLLLILFVFIIVLVICASIDTRQFGLFRQSRVGKHAKPFTLYKIRTIRGDRTPSPKEVNRFSSRFGKFLSRLKLNELPQLFNILKGDMSFIGPRPDVPGYADKLKGDDRVVLSIRPGLTGPATLKYRDEQNLLLKQENPQQYNDEVIWPDKVKINREYVENWSFKKDLMYLWRTIFP